MLKRNSLWGIGEAWRAKLAMLCYDIGMIRTRDFLLLLIIIGFFLVVITAQTASRFFVSNTEDVQISTNPVFEDEEFNDIYAEIVIRDDIDRQANIEHLRKKLQDYIANQPEPEAKLLAPSLDSELIDLSASTTQQEKVIPNEALLCAGYKVYEGAWPNELLSIEMQEGVRVISAEDEALGSDEVGVMAVLPVRTLGSSLSPSCLPTDVVAIAQSGSLIRNNETEGYRAFPEHVLIGYTLDGFKLYGYSDKETDHCGGVMVNDEYRYYLSGDRQNVLNCFAAPPAALP